MNTIDSLAFMSSLKIGRQCTPPPPGMEKLKSKVNVTFWLSGQSDTLVLADVPPPLGMEKLKSLVNVTFWLSGQSDTLVLAVVPPPRNGKV